MEPDSNADRRGRRPVHSRPSPAQAALPVVDDDFPDEPLAELPAESPDEPPDEPPEDGLPSLGALSLALLSLVCDDEVPASLVSVPEPLDVFSRLSVR
jgi:hypothetical protein